MSLDEAMQEMEVVNCDFVTIWFTETGVLFVILIKFSSIVVLEVVILTKFSSLAALEVIILTTSCAANHENLVKMLTFPFQCSM